MPLEEVTEASPDVNGEQYILFFASGSPSWCPDCREALPAIEQVFGSETAARLQVVKIGTRDEWRSTSNRWRGEPFLVTETPCIIKHIDSKEIARLGDQDCKSVSLLQKLLTAS